MNHKTIFLDKVFWGRIWPSLMGCISQGMTTSISLIIIWWLNGSLEVIFEAAVVRQIIILSVVTNVLINGGILLLEILYAWKVANLFLIPIDSSINFRGIKDHVDISQEGEAYVRYGLPSVLLFLNAITFLIPYILGERWATALLNSTVAILPFHVAGLTLHIIKIGIEIIFLFIRYIVQRHR